MSVATELSESEGTTSDDDSPRFAIEDILGLAVMIVCVGVIVASLHPNLLVRNTTANGGDMGAHVWWPAFLRDHWFNHFRLAGWAPDWYAGFPVGQFYFPLPALLIDLLSIVMPYDIAFKLVTVSGPLLLPIAAYTFARTLRFPWPSPPLFALATLRYVFETRRGAVSEGQDAWTIYGGNLASTLAGEFSYVLAIALGLFFLAAFASALEQRRRYWLPAVLLAATVLCHIVVAVFVVVGGVAVWIIRRPTRTWKPTIAIGVVGALITAIWSLPLLVDTPYTQSMRYEKVETFAIHLFGFRADQHHPLMPRPPWMWALIVVAVLAAGWWRRGSTLVLIIMATSFALLFRYWPEHSVWNTRFLPLYYLAIGLLAAVGVAELMRVGATLARRAYDWIREGDRLDALARELDVDDASQPDIDQFDPAIHAWRRRLVGVFTLLVLLACVSVPTVWWVVDNEGVAPAWAQWNYEGYQSRKAWPEYHDIITTMGKLPPGRALWEPSSEINEYGTTLALELLPYFTHGRIGSMEGLYFESSMTTDFHFLTVSELTASGSASNPVRGLEYGTINDFDEGVRHMRMLGVRYFMAQSAEAKRRADQSDGLRLVATVPDFDKLKPLGWKIYEVRGWNLAEALTYEPVVAKAGGGPSSRCFGTPAPASASHDPELAPWECAAAPWWMKGDLDRPFAADGPSNWARASSAAAAAKVTPRPLPAVKVGPVAERVDSVSFHVSRTGVPIVVKTSYFPNWKAHGASGPWRLAPNLMVVIPTSHDVKLTYGLTTGDRAGRILTVVGLLGIVVLARVRPVADPLDPEPFAPGAEDESEESEPEEPEPEVVEPGEAPEESEEAGQPAEVPAIP